MKHFAPMGSIRNHGRNIVQHISIGQTLCRKLVCQYQDFVHIFQSPCHRKFLGNKNVKKKHHIFHCSFNHLAQNAKIDLFQITQKTTTFDTEGSCNKFFSKKFSIFLKTKTSVLSIWRITPDAIFYNIFSWLQHFWPTSTPNVPARGTFSRKSSVFA